MAARSSLLIARSIVRCLLSVVNSQSDSRFPFTDFAYAFHKRLKGLLGLFQAAWTDMCAEDDAPVCSVVGSVSRLQHGAVARHESIEAHLRELLALFATGCIV